MIAFMGRWHQGIEGYIKWGIPTFLVMQSIHRERQASASLKSSLILFEDLIILFELQQPLFSQARPSCVKNESQLFIAVATRLDSPAWELSPPPQKKMNRFIAAALPIQLLLSGRTLATALHLVDEVSTDSVTIETVSTSTGLLDGPKILETANDTTYEW